MEQNAPCFSPHILWICIILPMYHDFLGPRGLQGTHMDTLKPKNSKLITFTVREGFFTFWAILAHSASLRPCRPVDFLLTPHWQHFPVLFVLFEKNAASNPVIFQVTKSWLKRQNLIFLFDPYHCATLWSVFGSLIQKSIDFKRY